MIGQDTIQQAESVDSDSEIRERFLCLNSMDSEGDVPVEIQKLQVNFGYSGDILYRGRITSNIKEKQIGIEKTKDDLKNNLGVKFSGSFGPSINDTDADVEDYYTLPVFKIYITYTYHNKSSKTIKHVSKGSPDNFLYALYKNIRSNFNSISDYNQEDSTISAYYNFEDSKLKVDKRSSGVEVKEEEYKDDKNSDSINKFEEWMKLWSDNSLSENNKILEPRVSDVRHNSSENKIYILVDCKYDTVTFTLEVKESEDSEIWQVIKSYGYGDIVELKQSNLVLVHSTKLLDQKIKSYEKHNIASDNFNEFFLILNPEDFRSKDEERSLIERLSAYIPSLFNN
jgi:hypothetical protein